MSFCRFFMILFGIVQAVFIQASVWAVPAEGHKLMMAAPSPLAIEAGREIGLEGGNVVDVAVGMALTLSVTSPYFASLGGGGFALVKMPEHPVEALDFREMAPAATSPSYFYKRIETASRDGGSAVGVPGIPAGLWELHHKYGKMEWKKLFRKASELSKNGFRVSGEWARYTAESKSRFQGSGVKVFFKPNAEALLPGEELKQPNLALALDLFKDQGPKGFYEGKVAEDIAHTVTAAGGVMTTKDLKNYKVRWLTPLETTYNGYHLYLMPPPSSGGVIVKTALELVERANLTEKKFLSVDELHWLAEIESRSFRGRMLLGDPDFHTNPLKFLNSKSQLDFLFNSINATKATEIPALSDRRPTQESDDTTHLNVMDADGNAVSMTITLNGDYGSGVVSDKFGIALNNEMDDFTTKPNSQNMFGLYQGQGNNVQPGKRPLSSMTPTLVEKNDRVVMAIGAPGGPRIISGVFQVLYRILGQSMDTDRAIQAPRLHHQFMPNTLIVDKERLPPESIEALKKRGHKVEERSIARVYVVRLNDAGILEGAFDSRGEGAAGGY